MHWVPRCRPSGCSYGMVRALKLRGCLAYDEQGYALACVEAGSLVLHGLNIILAPNGSGKTTILELLHPILNVTRSVDTDEADLYSILYSSLRPRGSAVGYARLDDNLVLGWVRLAVTASPEAKRLVFTGLRASTAGAVEEEFVDGLRTLGEALALELVKGRLSVDAIRRAASILGRGWDKLVPLPGKSEVGFSAGREEARYLHRNTFVSVLLASGQVVAVMVYWHRGVPLAALVNTHVEADAPAVVHYHPAAVTRVLRARDVWERGLHVAPKIVGRLRETAQTLLPGFQDVKLLRVVDEPALFVEVESAGSRVLLPLSALGDGQRAALTLALLYSVARERNLVLAADSVESFTHPDLSLPLAELLAELAEGPGVIMATQSLEMLKHSLAHAVKRGVYSRVYRIRLSRRVEEQRVLTTIKLEGLEGPEVLKAVERFGIDVRLYNPLGLAGVDHG